MYDVLSSVVDISNKLVVRTMNAELSNYKKCDTARLRFMHNHSVLVLLI